MLNIYCQILKSYLKTFGLNLGFFTWMFLVPAYLLFTHITLFLDNIFFYEYRRTQIKAPVFIIGNPRSGTTFLHQSLTQTGDFSAFKAWHLFFPSLTARILVKPIINRLISTNRSTIVPGKVGSSTDLDKVKTEEWLFLHVLDTQFLFIMTPLGFDDIEHSEIRLNDRQKPNRRQRSVKFLKGCLQRQIYYTGKEQIIAKMHFSTNRVKTLLEAFPDAKFIYLVRSPYETIPSDLSLNRNVIDFLWGLENIPHDKLVRYFERRYRSAAEMYQYFYDVIKHREVPTESFMILKYSCLIDNFMNVFNEIIFHTNIISSQQLQQSAKELNQKQKMYKRKHKVLTLEDFGLNKTKLAKELSFVFKEYGFEK